jgi:hypothetical protein
MVLGAWVRRCEDVGVIVLDARVVQCEGARFDGARCAGNIVLGMTVRWCSVHG